MKKYVKMKVFDCQDMPKEIQREFYEQSDAGNDVYINRWVENPTDNVVDKWLIENGAIEGEEVLINHWW